MSSESNAVETWPRVLTDYQGALIRLITAYAEKRDHLLMGYVELFPRDVAVPDTFYVGDEPWSVPGFGGDIKLGASATKMSVPDALVWYENARNGRVLFPGKTKRIKCSTFGPEPAVGHFCSGEDVPFAAGWHEDFRIHRLVPMEDIDEVILGLQTNEEANEWLLDSLGFSPLQHEDWLGSVAMLAPDPLLSGVGHYSYEVRSDGAERTVLQLHRRRYDGYPKEEADALKVVLLQKRPSGWMDVTPTEADEEGFSICDAPEPAGESGYAIHCPIRGLLRFNPPLHWIGQINVGMSIVNAVVNVEVPSGGRRKPASQYTTHRLDEMGLIAAGETLPRSGRVRLVELQEEKRKRVERENAPQRLFGIRALDKAELSGGNLTEMREQAEAYVASLLVAARRRIIFVDPEFGVREFQKYALRVQRDGVSIEVLTGARRLRMTSNAKGSSSAGSGETLPTPEPAVPHGFKFLEQLKYTQREIGPGAPEVYVMPGSRKPLFHDRFIVVDDVVWACGPSFNELGERMGLVSKVHEPRAVISAIQEALKRSTTLSNWVAEFKPEEDQDDTNDDTES